MGVDIGEAHLDLGDAVRVRCRLGFGQEAGALEVRGEDPVEETIRSARRFLGDAADAGSARQRHVARVRMQVAGDELQERRFARAVTPDEAHPVAFGDSRGGAF